MLSLGDKTTYHGWCDNIHEGGLGATVAAPLKKNDEVTLRFDLPGSPEPIEVRGIVRHTNGFRHGFEFLNLSSTQYARILAFPTAANRKSGNPSPSPRGLKGGPDVKNNAVHLVPDLPVLA